MWGKKAVPNYFSNNISKTLICIDKLRHTCTLINFL